MLSQEELNTYLNDLYHPEQFKDFCPNGLQVEGSKSIKKIAFAVSACEESILSAAKQGADALVVHHGLFWNHQPFVCRGAMYRKLKILMEHHINLWAYHLPMDAHRQFGNNWPVAEQLQLDDLEGFGECAGSLVGVKGTCPVIELNKLIPKIKKIYGKNELVLAGDKSTISTVAIISGGAHKELDRAVQEGIDLFITGTCDEPQWHIANENGVVFIPIGHSLSETIGPKLLMQELERTFPISCIWLDDNNPY